MIVYGCSLLLSLRILHFYDWRCHCGMVTVPQGWTRIRNSIMNIFYIHYGTNLRVGRGTCIYASFGKQPRSSCVHCILPVCNCGSTRILEILRLGNSIVCTGNIYDIFLMSSLLQLHDTCGCINQETHDKIMYAVPAAYRTQFSNSNSLDGGVSKIETDFRC